MALSMTTTVSVANKSVSFDSAYCIVATIAGSKAHMIANVEFRVARDGALIDCRGYPFSHDCESADNCIRQAYLHLKTLPEFANAVDC